MVQAWELGIRLRQRREEVGFTAAAAGRAIGIIQAYVSGVESGRVTRPPAGGMIEAYEFEPDDAAELEQLRAGAEHIRSFHPEAIHGLLQTEEYARAVIRGGTTTIRLTEVERRVAVRMARQARLDGAHPLRVSALLSEGALRQQVMRR